jgi:hypothetical protein
MYRALKKCPGVIPTVGSEGRRVCAQGNELVPRRNLGASVFPYVVHRLKGGRIGALQKNLANHPGPSAAPVQSWQESAKRRFSQRGSVAPYLRHCIEGLPGCWHDREGVWGGWEERGV